MTPSACPFEAWRALIEGLGGSLPDADLIYWQLVAPRYGEIHRGYHTIVHVGRCLDFLEQACPGTGPMVTKLALWFHDVIYDPRRKDNEERSADVLLGACALMSVPRPYAEDAFAAVLATKHDGSAPSSRVTRLTLDADLASLGAPWDEFRANSDGIRKEYSFVSEDAYREGRRKILQGFLDRPSLYFTPEFHDLFDAQARENLRRALEELG